MLQGKGEAIVQGEWKQDTLALQKKLVTYSLYNFKFNCDSFFVQIKTYSKVNNGADTCTNHNRWAEYTKGTYTLSHDTLQLNGLYCNPDYSLKKEGGCFRFGVYQENFKIKKTTDSVFQFLNLASVTPFNIHLTKKITCKPKPL